MPRKGYPTRREFVAAAPALAAVGNSLRAATLETLTPAEAALLELLCEQVIPSSPASPGAREAGCVAYIDHQLAGALKRFRPNYAKGLALLPSGFAEMSFDRRTSYLQTLPPGPLTSFFQLVVDHTWQGFLGDPKHGGNRGEAGWKLLGIAEHRHP